MSTSPLYLGQTPLHSTNKPVSGEFVERHGEQFYRITNFDAMRPFFMSIVSDSDHWMFISSNGGLTAGRQNITKALFPYITDDKIHDVHEHTGNKSIFHITRGDKTYLWEPLSDHHRGLYDVSCNLYKNFYGNKIIFEEINHDLDVRFATMWGNSEQFGFVKRSELENLGDTTVETRLLDGIQNILPYGVEPAMQMERSTLLDAYKKNELVEASGLGLFVLSSIPVDRPEPSEALMATTVWSTGLPTESYLLCSQQLQEFREGRGVVPEIDIRAERGAFFVQASVSLAPSASENWYIIAELEQDARHVSDLSAWLLSDTDHRKELEATIEAGSQNLHRIVANADGIQDTGDQMADARHYMNVLFNIMRGGIFADGNNVGRDHLAATVAHFNHAVKANHQTWFDRLPEKLPVTEMLQLARQQGDPQLERLCQEYLPLTFSRRHGDPSRPWNYFSIDTRNPDGSQKLSYQGNWRDIFQNWEALALSFPDFLESMIAKFLSASTADGYNPYRITSEGIDWEVLEPDDPWAYIGYWGDHQIIYLQKLLELSDQYHPGKLTDFLTRPIFSYANVPYRIKSYEDILKDPHDTIIFDQELEDEIQNRVASVGADGKLLWDAEGHVYLANFTEKWLVMVLAKLSNFVPGAGIWLNTQRPEWNDANNALVGYGTSMVTLNYLRRMLAFSAELFAKAGDGSAEVSSEVAVCLSAIQDVFEQSVPALEAGFTPQSRRTMLDGLEKTGSQYRKSLYANGLSADRREAVSFAFLQSFCLEVLKFVDASIRESQRDDKLFHAYNWIAFEDDGVTIRPLYEMLEGQAAALSSGLLNGREAAEVLDALRASAIYRPDQESYMLYPDRQLEQFVEKNTIPAQALHQIPLIGQLVEAGNEDLVIVDGQGQLHFNGRFRNGQSIREALQHLAQNGYEAAVERDGPRIETLFATLFDHESYTGRSGAFYGYEGLGSIYWHMVSKLVLATIETYQRARDAGENEEVLNRLMAHFIEARDGIGIGKSPDHYGGFPMDPYSHTPANAGVQQPGMTGQVKEDIISRWIEQNTIREHAK